VTGGFRHLGDTEVVQRNRIRLVDAEFEAPDGSHFERVVIRDIGWVAVVPLLDDGVSVLLVRQYRGPVDEWLLELPAGVRDVEDEPLEVTAARELVEEAGRTAGSLERLVRIYNSPGISDDEGVVFLARDLVEVPTDVQGPEEEHMTTEVVALADVPAMAADGRLLDAKTVVGLLMAREHLGLRT
jgi:8-oxo-dGTP pyrophosphatase MutT (NUDIX family)